MSEGPAGRTRAPQEESVPHDESGPRGMDQGAEGWIRPPGTDQGSAGRIRVPGDVSGPIGIDWGPTGRISAPEEESGPRGSGKGPALTDRGPERRIRAPRDVSGPRGADQSPERRIRVPLDEPGPFKRNRLCGTDQGLRVPDPLTRPPAELVSLTRSDRAPASARSYLKISRPLDGRPNRGRGEHWKNRGVSTPGILTPCPK